jgi:hypothetical protein
MVEEGTRERERDLCCKIIKEAEIRSSTRSCNIRKKGDERNKNRK